jgi:hypothetical protein
MTEHKLRRAHVIAGGFPPGSSAGHDHDHWLGLNGTSGGRAQKVEGVRQRRTVRTEHHARERRVQRTGALRDRVGHVIA